MTRLRTASGQLSGDRMVENGRYYIDVLDQLSAAVTAAIDAVAVLVLSDRSHQLLRARGDPAR